MKKHKDENHEYVPTIGGEIAKELDLKNLISEYDLLMDIKALMKYFYLATFNEDNDALLLSFNNGQKFKVSVSSVQ